MKVADPTKPENPRAWFLVAPATILLLLCLEAPLAAIIVRSLSGEGGFVGERWFVDVLEGQGFWLAAARSFGFSAAALLIQIPLGLWIALHTPRAGWGAGVSLVAMALPLMIPAGSVGLIWNAFAVAPDAPLAAANAAGNPVAAWAMLLAMDAWRWTGLIALLVYVRLGDAPEPLLLAARVDGASGWSIFRHVQLPLLWRSLGVAALIRFADSMAGYGDVLVLNAGGPREATTLLALELRRYSAPADFGHAAAMGLVYVAALLAFARLAFVVFGRSREDAR
jgi:glycerol transport system permease protein